MYSRPDGLSLFGLDRNVRQAYIYPRFSKKMVSMFARTCKRAESETAFIRLLVAAVGAEPESYTQKKETNLAAVAILKRHPELLFKNGMVTDHFGRKICGSAYKILLGAGDTWALTQVHKEIIPKIDGGAEKAQEQFKQQFPHCQLLFSSKISEAVLYDDRNIAQVLQTKEILKKVVAAISTDPCTHGKSTLPATTAAIEELHGLFAPKEDEVICTGLHFPIGILREVFRVYGDHFYHPWNDGQLSFFSREVIGAVLAASTVVDGQSYKHGVFKLNFKRGPDRRDGLFCRHPKGLPAEHAPLNDKLGRTMFVDPYDGGSCFLAGSHPGYFDWYTKKGRWSRHATCGALAGMRASIGKLVWNKKLQLTKLIYQNRNLPQKTSRIGV